MPGGSHQQNRSSVSPVGSSSRYRDGRTSVYSAPSRSMIHDRRAPFTHRRPEPSHRYAGPRRPSPYHYNPYAHRYVHHAFSPVWWGPVVYPAAALGFFWSSGSFGFSVASYTPSYYSHTRYYDSWHCGGRGYSSLYYGGWSSGWYGGFSYVYNPWPVYRTYYLYEPAPVVTRTETVYVTQPATTTYVVQEPASAPLAPASWEQQAPAASTGSGETATCFCACHCNGQKPCTCEYPCGSEYAYDASAFDLSLAYEPYAESLDPETIWSSYAGLDRFDPDTEAFADTATVQTGNDPM